MPLVYLWIQYTMLYLQYSGFPHSEIIGSQLICNSPMLIAAYRVLRRQSVPGHPPCALISLILFGRSYWLLRTDMSALNVCRSVAALHTSSPTRFLRFHFCFFPFGFRFCSFALRFRFVLCFSQSFYSLLLFPVQFSRCVLLSIAGKWWAEVDSNHRPLAYQASALTG